MAQHDEHHILPIRTYISVFGSLMVLLLFTLLASFFGMPPLLAVIVALIIASSKAILIMTFFMNVRQSEKLIWVFAGMGFVGLFVFLLILMSDYLTRTPIY